jgi:hypothetical protein
MVFLDENAIRFFDPDLLTDEERFLMLGISIQQAFTKTSPGASSMCCVSYRLADRIKQDI